MKIFILLFALTLSTTCYATHKNADDTSYNTPPTEESSENRPWWIGDLLTVLGIIAGAGIIVFQLNKQHKNDIEVQKENYREKLRLDVYQEFYNCLENANHKASDISMYAFLIDSNMQNYIQQRASGISPPAIKARAKEFSDLHFKANNTIINLIKLIEKHEIVSPELEVFKLALNSASHNISEAFSPLYSFLLGILPMDAIDAANNPIVINVITPTEEQMSELEQLINVYKNSHDDLGGYLYDLNIELQKIFLSRLFSNKVKTREPIDPNIKVITTDPNKIDELMRYFKEESPWGIHMNEVEEDVRRSFNSP